MNHISAFTSSSSFLLVSSIGGEGSAITSMTSFEIGSNSASILAGIGGEIFVLLNLIPYPM